MSTADIVLTTLNAKYIHASLGLRYLAANLAELRARSRIREFVIEERPADIVERLLADSPRIVGFGVYIWNVEATTAVIALLKAIDPTVAIVLGGPEVSHETEGQEIVALADFVITGWGEASFLRLCRRLLHGARPATKLIAGEQPPLARIAMPYRWYTDTDIAERLIYVEASRGCPYRCEFCLSALDRSARPFAIDRFLSEMAALHARGARHFKFVDRTFNLDIESGLAILDFFLERIDDRLFLHFELVPDRLPDPLKAAISRFPPGSLQFEIGVQTFNPEVQARIHRRQDDVRTAGNLRWLREHSQAHLHVDLIAGLPGENLASFGAGFDRLHALGPHEIQVGILKRLRGAPIVRHTGAHAMRYNPSPPYNVLATDVLDFFELQRLSRFARYWDLLGNSGRFLHTLPLLTADRPFARFLRFSDWLYARTGKTHAFSPKRLFDLLAEALTSEFALEPQLVQASLARDYSACGLRGAPAFPRTEANGNPNENPRSRHTERQDRHRRPSAGAAL
jgi:hypothetical protein